MGREQISAQQFRSKLNALLSQPTRPRKKPYRNTRLAIFDIPIATAALSRMTRTLDTLMLPMMKQVGDRIPASIIKELKINYAEALPKTMRIHTTELNSEKSRAWRTAKHLGILDILQSDSLRRFGEQVTGKPLQSDPGCQIICYRPGDFSGPHTDHHPENPEYRRGYVDIHIMLSSPRVSSQLLVYEGSDGMLDNVYEVGSGLSLAVYQLPFWHYTTPLLARSQAQNAHRWLLLATYTTRVE